MSGKLRWIIVLFVGVSFAFAFPFYDIYDQKGYYMFPIRPGEINYLSGSMGELRSTHFHAGIDIKTGGVQGYNVYAAADGFVNRVKISTGGYGKALYLQHPNNTFTVYAHLRDFSKEVADYVRAQQYKKQSYQVDLYPPKNRFSFKKGDIIAASGNTGSSSAPHLHFEIRDENHRVLDPLRFGFSEIVDSRVPEVQAIAFKSLDLDARINGKFGRFDFKVRRDGANFYLDKPVNLIGKVGIEIYAYDRQNDTRNRYGVPRLELYQNGELAYRHQIKTFAFRDTRNLLVHTNYQHMIDTRRRYHKLYLEDGNELKFYGMQGRGVLNITDSSAQSFEIKLWDVEGNHSVMNFRVNEGVPVEDVVPRLRKDGEYDIVDNVLQLVKKYEVGQNRISVFANRFKYELNPSYSHKGLSYYLWDLRNGLPDSVDYCGEMKVMDFRTVVPPKGEFSFFGDQITMEFGKRTLFDTLYLQSSVKLDTVNQREVFHFNHGRVPFRRNVKVTLKPNISIEDQDRTAVYVLGKKGGLGFVGGEWQDNGGISFYTRDLVDFTLAVDSLAPTVKPIKVNSKEMSFIIDDDMSGIKSYEARVDGKWVLMNYERKRKLIWSEKLNENIPFVGELILTVEDQVGNQTEYKTIL